MLNAKLWKPVVLAASLGLMASFSFGKELKSGIEKGGSLPAYHPKHLSGVDKNSDTCPVCKYPANPAVQVWINTDDMRNVEALLVDLEKTAKANADKKLKVFAVFFNPNGKSEDAFRKQLQDMVAKNKIQHVAVTYLDGPKNSAVEKYQINTAADVKNTVFVYKARKVSEKFVNLTADSKGLQTLNGAIKAVLM